MFVAIMPAGMGRGRSLSIKYDVDIKFREWLPEWPYGSSAIGPFGGPDRDTSCNLRISVKGKLRRRSGKCVSVSLPRVPKKDRIPLRIDCILTPIMS